MKKKCTFAPQMDKARQSIATSFLSLPHIYYMCSLPMKLAPKQDDKNTKMKSVRNFKARKRTLSLCLRLRLKSPSNTTLKQHALHLAAHGHNSLSQIRDDIVAWFAVPTRHPAFGDWHKT
ncbi:hypothetical protein [Prevotella sp. S7-1-8]|uniref:hypothetical protein n=1 Tax=Prevotella sp. S7-1-8 TaxID=1284775 RepID=UPI0012E0AC2D|nr:hypothetical protein [Prevotella sp. S7-1-8]